MKNFLYKIKSYVVAHKIISIIVLIALLGAGYWGYKKFTSTSEDIRYVTAKVEKGTIIASVSGTGQVSSSNQVDIKAKVSGDVVYVNAQDGQNIGVGGLIAKLDDQDIQKSVRDAEINLESARIALEKLKIQKSKENMNADLAKAYDDGFNAVSDTFLDLPSIITGLEDILGNENLGDNAARTSGKTAQNYRSLAETKYYSAKNTFEKNRKFYRTLSHNSPKEEIEKIINETYETTKLVSDAIKNLRNFVDFMAEDASDTSGFTSSQSTLSTYTSTTSEHLDALLSIKTSIKDYKDAFLDSDFDIKSSELSVKQKENALQDAKDKLADYFIRAPFAGTLALVNIKKSNTISAGTIVATIVTTKQLAEISLNEVDVAKIKIGQKATLTFDAIPDLFISGIVAEIDTIGTVSQGVVTYIVKTSFDTQDERVKSAMSVSGVIITDMKEDVLVVPNSAVKSQGGTSYVESFDIPLLPPMDGLIGTISKIIPNKTLVEVGLSNDRDSEIILGVKEGDEIIIRKILPTAETGTSTPSIFGSPAGGNRGTRAN